MNNNLRTVKRDDLCEFVKGIVKGILKECHTSNISFEIRSFYFDFCFTIDDNFNKVGFIEDAMNNLYNRGIIMEKLPENFCAYDRNVETHLTLIHPFNVVD